jgi:hypothetical protein
MPILLLILATVLALAWRARVVQRCLNPVEAAMHDESGLVDTCMRSSLLVLMSLLGLLVLGVMYGSVLGVSNAAP